MEGLQRAGLDRRTLAAICLRRPLLISAAPSALLGSPQFVVRREPLRTVAWRRTLDRSPVGLVSRLGVALSPCRGLWQFEADFVVPGLPSRTSSVRGHSCTHELFAQPSVSSGAPAIPKQIRCDQQRLRGGHPPHHRADVHALRRSSCNHYSVNFARRQQAVFAAFSE